jgi:hypothetical protein
MVCSQTKVQRPFRRAMRSAITARVAQRVCGMHASSVPTATSIGVVNVGMGL